MHEAMGVAQLPDLQADIDALFAGDKVTDILAALETQAATGDEKPLGRKSRLTLSTPITDQRGGGFAANARWRGARF